MTARHGGDWVTEGSLAGRVCLVTGATGALGREVATVFAQQGADVVLLCRDERKGRALESEIRHGSGHGSVELLIANLSVLASVREAAAGFLSGRGRLHVLVNNAGVFVRDRQLTPDGLETMFATNYLGPFLLTNLLAPALKADPPARVLTVSAPSTTELDFDDLQGERKFSALRAFGASKMADLLFTYEFARRLEGTGVMANAVHPGLMRSGLMRQASAPIRMLTRLASRPPARAAQSVLHLASSPEFAGMTGRFFKGTRLSESAAYSRDVAVQRRLWQASERLVGQAFAAE